MSLPTIYTLSEIRAASFPVPEPIVKGLLSEGETIVLVGKPKAGKTRLTQQLTICLSRSECFLGMEVPKCRKVLYLDLENRPAGAQHRFQVMSTAHPGDELVKIYAPETLAENRVLPASVRDCRWSRLLV